MWQINRYVSVAIAKGYFIVALVLVLLFCLILFIKELDDVGTGRYQLQHALRYILFMMPKLLIDLASLAGLVGSIVGLGVLAKNNELVAMQAAGISPKHIAKVIFFFGLAIMLFILLANQFVVPATTRAANIGKALSMSDSNDLVGGTGFWAQNERVFLHVEDTLLGKVPHNIEIFEFSIERALTRYIHAEKALFQPDGSWLLKQVLIREYKGNDIVESKENSFEWRSFLGSSQTAIINAAQEGLSITELYKYFQSLKKRGEQYDHHELLFWQKISAPVVTISMMLIGIIFMFGSLRTTAISTRITVAVLLSIFFYFLNQIVMHIGTLVQLPSIVIVAIPLVIISAVAYMLLQLKWKMHVE